MNFKGLIKHVKQHDGELNKLVLIKYMGKHGYCGYYNIKLDNGKQLWMFCKDAECELINDCYFFYNFDPSYTSFNPSIITKGKLKYGYDECSRMAHFNYDTEDNIEEVGELIYDFTGGE